MSLFLRMHVLSIASQENETRLVLRKGQTERRVVWDTLTVESLSLDWDGG